MVIGRDSNRHSCKKRAVATTGRFDRYLDLCLGHLREEGQDVDDGPGDDCREELESIRSITLALFPAEQPYFKENLGHAAEDYWKDADLLPAVSDGYGKDSRDEEAGDDVQEVVVRELVDEGVPYPRQPLGYELFHKNIIKSATLTTKIPIMPQRKSSSSTEWSS